MCPLHRLVEGFAIFGDTQTTLQANPTAEAGAVDEVFQFASKENQKTSEPTNRKI